MYPCSTKARSCAAPVATPSYRAVEPPGRRRRIALAREGSSAPSPTFRGAVRTVTRSSYATTVTISRGSRKFNASRAPSFAFSIFASASMDPDLSRTIATASGARENTLRPSGRTSARTITRCPPRLSTTGVSARTSKTTGAFSSATARSTAPPHPRTSAAAPKTIIDLFRNMTTTSG